MQRNSYFLRSLPILAALALLVLGSYLANGIWSLRQAEQTKDASEAARWFETAAIRLFWRSDLWERAGVSAQQAGQPEEAIRLLRRADSISRQGWLALGQAYLQTGQVEPARESFESSLELGASSQAYAGLSQVEQKLGNLEAERSALTNQLLLDPGNAAAQYRLGLLLSLLDINSALTHFQMASQLDPEYGPVYETLRSALNLAELSPTEGGRLITLGRGLGLVDEWRLAARAFEAATQAEANDAEAWAWLGEAKQHLGQDGRLELDQALTLDPNSVVVRGLRGLYWKRIGDHRQALTEYRAAAALEPDNPAWKASLGETYARLGDLVLALTNFQRATELAPNESTYWRLLAVFCVENGVQTEEVGLPAAQKAVTLAPEDPLARDILGWTQLSLGKFYTAEQTLLSVLKLSPDLASAHLHLALVYLQTGDRNAAYVHLRRVMEVDPNGISGQQADTILKQYFP